ncbi:MAG: MFS transporter [bacterium]|nr:MFS transporter [bacterium]
MSVIEKNISRTRALRKNFYTLFFIQAFSCVKTFNLVAVFFYLARGLSFSEIFYLSIVWSITVLIFEVPSSYLADIWGRKQAIILSSILYTLGVTLVLIANSFAIFALSFFVTALAYACRSGTDDAMIYDTAQELGLKKESLSRLASYYSAEKIFKIATPLLAAIVATDLQMYQFVYLIYFDLFFSIIALIFSFFLVEPKHKHDVEKTEAGVFVDAWKILRYNPIIRSAAINKAIIFFSSFVIWRIHTVFFVDLGLSILVLGIGWSLFNLFGFIALRKINLLAPSMTVAKKINWLNILFISFTVLLLSGWIFGVSPYLLVAFYFLSAFCENIRESLFSYYFNENSYSYNRATMLSLTSFVKSVLDVPLLFIISYLAQINFTYLFIAIIIFSISIIIFLPLRRQRVTLART